jgi:DNA primase
MQTMIEHLKARHLDLNLHRPVVDEVDRIATFFLYNLSGQVVGYQQYRPEGEKKPQNSPKEGKYFTYRRKDTIGVWGLESLALNSKVVFLTEGIFDACRLTKLGATAFAVLTNNPSPDLRNWLYMLNRKVVAVCDNDNAGKKLAKFGHEAVFTEDSDLGDAPESYVKELLARYSLPN